MTMAAVENGYQVYKPAFAERLSRMLGFGLPSANLLSAEEIAQGWNEEVFTHTDLRIGFGDRLRLLLTGRAKIRIITSAKVQIPEALVSVSFAPSQ